jgi:hypothetical protein
MGAVLAFLVLYFLECTGKFFYGHAPLSFPMVNSVASNLLNSPYSITSFARIFWIGDRNGPNSTAKGPTGD